jgi:putative ABC transport system substrate-binding protein
MLVGGAAAWPLAARAQQSNRVRRIGVLMFGKEDDPMWKPRLSAFTQALAGLGWTDGRNMRMELRWTDDDNSRVRALAQELVGLQLDIILTSGTPATAAVQR